MTIKISISVPAKAPRNGHVAAAVVRSGAGAHGKTRKAQRRSDRIALIKRALEVSLSGQRAAQAGPQA